MEWCSAAYGSVDEVQTDQGDDDGKDSLVSSKREFLVVIGNKTVWTVLGSFDGIFESLSLPRSKVDFDTMKGGWKWIWVVCWPAEGGQKTPRHLPKR